MPTPYTAPYKVEQRDLKARARKARLVGFGDQHKAESSRQQLRDVQRKNGSFRAGSFGRGLTNVSTARQKRALEQVR